MRHVRIGGSCDLMPGNRFEHQSDVHDVDKARERIYFWHGIAKSIKESEVEVINQNDYFWVKFFLLLFLISSSAHS